MRVWKNRRGDLKIEFSCSEALVYSHMLLMRGARSKSQDDNDATVEVGIALNDQAIEFQQDARPNGPTNIHSEFPLEVQAVIQAFAQLDTAIENTYGFYHVDGRRTRATQSPGWRAVSGNSADA
jgi:hypothetical protein